MCITFVRHKENFSPVILCADLNRRSYRPQQYIYYIRHIEIAVLSRENNILYIYLLLQCILHILIDLDEIHKLGRPHIVCIHTYIHIYSICI